MVSPGGIVTDEIPATAPRSRALAAIVTVIAVAMSLYHMYVAAFGPPEALVFRGTHLLFALTLVYLLDPLRPGASAAWRVADLALLAAGRAYVLHINLGYDNFINRIINIGDLHIEIFCSDALINTPLFHFCNKRNAFIHRYCQGLCATHATKTGSNIKCSPQ